MFADKIYILISGLIIGIILYQSSIVAITVFKNLDEKNTSIFLRKIFPQFFKAIIFLNAASLILSFFSFSIIKIIVSFSSIILALICLKIIPETNKAADEKNQKKFKNLHTLSVLSTMLILIMNTLIIFLI
ncbi:MAG: hypothetical protein CMF91_01265 [Candidatus Marinimicrobia bacterium]|nr:hypothetical protein [Candidatus Neomarinimicrobiota bacterium]